MIALILGVATYAFTATNVVPGSAAGQGSGSIVGYTISSVAYTLDLTSPQQVTQVRFTLNAAPASATSVRAQVNTSSFGVCSLAASTSTTSTWTCPLTGVSAAAASPTLRVVAAQ